MWPNKNTVGGGEGTKKKHHSPRGRTIRSRAFGAPLPKEGGKGSMPLFDKLIKFLLREGLETEGLFQDSVAFGYRSEVETLKKKIVFEKEKTKLSQYAKDPLIVGEMLRQFLVALPEPLLTFQLYDSFLLTLTLLEKADRVEWLRSLIQTLPPGYIYTIKQVLNLLHIIHTKAVINQNTSNKLAYVFGPLFLRPLEVLYYMRDDGSQIVELVKLLIEEYPAISEPETRKRAPTNRTASLVSRKLIRQQHDSPGSSSLIMDEPLVPTIMLSAPGQQGTLETDLLLSDGDGSLHHHHNHQKGKEKETDKADSNEGGRGGGGHLLDEPNVSDGSPSSSLRTSDDYTTVPYNDDDTSHNNKNLISIDESPQPAHRGPDDGYMDDRDNNKVATNVMDTSEQPASAPIEGQETSNEDGVNNDNRRSKKKERRPSILRKGIYDEEQQGAEVTNNIDGDNEGGKNINNQDPGLSESGSLSTDNNSSQLLDSDLMLEMNPSDVDTALNEVVEKGTPSHAAAAAQDTPTVPQQSEATPSAQENESGLPEHVRKRINEEEFEAPISEVPIGSPLVEERLDRDSTTEEMEEAGGPEAALEEVKEICDSLAERIKDSSVSEIMSIVKAVRPIRENLKTFFKEHNIVPPKGANEPATLASATTSSDSIASMKELIEEQEDQKKVLLEEINWVCSQLVELDQELNET